MIANIVQLTKLSAWQAIEAHYPKVRELHLRKLFADDPKRGERMAGEAVGNRHALLLDFLPEALALHTSGKLAEAALPLSRTGGNHRSHGVVGAGGDGRAGGDHRGHIQKEDRR